MQKQRYSVGAQVQQASYSGRAQALQWRDAARTAPALIPAAYDIIGATRLLHHDGQGGEARALVTGPEDSNPPPQRSRISGRLEFYLSRILEKLARRCHDQNTGIGAWNVNKSKK